MEPVDELVGVEMVSSEFRGTEKASGEIEEARSLIGTASTRRSLNR